MAGRKSEEENFMWFAIVVLAALFALALYVIGSPDLEGVL